MASEFIIKTKIDTKGAEADAKKIEQTLEEVANTASKTVDTVSSTMGEALKTVPNEEYVALEKELAKLDARFDSIVSKEEKFLATGGKTNSRTFKGYEYDLEQIASQIEDVKDRMALTDKTRPFVEQAKDIKKEGEEAEKTARKIKKLNVTHQTASKTTTKGSGIFSKFGAKIKASGKHIGAMAKKFLILAIGARGFLAIFNKLKSSVTTGINELVKYSDSLDKSLGEIVSSSKYLQASFTSAFAPIIEALAPKISAMIDNIAEGVNYIGMFIAKMMGASTYTRAIKNTQKYTEAIKGLNNALGAYDDLKVIGENEKSNGMLFEDVSLDGIDITGGIPSIMEKVNAFLATYDFSKIGKTIATGINNTLGNASFMANLGTGIARIVNGMISAIGGLFGTTNWTDVGKGLGQGLQKFVSNLDFEKYGSTVHDIVSGLLDLAISFLTNTDWGQVVLDLLSGISKAIKALNVQELYTKLHDGISAIQDAVVDILFDLIDNPETIVDILQTAITLFATYWVERLAGGAELVEKIITTIQDKFKETNWEEVKEKWKEAGGNLLDGIVEGFTDIKTRLEETWQKIVDGFKEFFGIHSPSKVFETLGGYLLSGLLLGFDTTKWDDKWEKLKKGATDFCDKVKEKFETLKTNLAIIFTSIKTKWETKIYDMKNIVKEPLNAILGFFEKMINHIIDGFNKIKVTIPSWVPSVGGKSYGANLSRVSLPRLATGAVIPPNREFMAVLGDQKRGTNIEAPLDTIKQAVAEVQGAQVVNLYISETDATPIMKWIRGQAQDYKKMYGTTGLT